MLHGIQYNFHTRIVKLLFIHNVWLTHLALIGKQFILCAESNPQKIRKTAHEKTNNWEAKKKSKTKQNMRK